MDNVWRAIPKWLSDKESACPAGNANSIPGSGRFPWRKKMATHSSILAWESHGQRSPVGCSPWGCKELDMTYRLNNSSSNDLWRKRERVFGMAGRTPR